MNQHVAWTEWSGLHAPSSIQLLSAQAAPLDEIDLSQITFYVPKYMGGRTALQYVERMPNLKVLQLPNAGYDDALEFVRPGMTLCNAQGIHDASTAELAVGLAIASRRGIPDFVRSQDRGEWNHSRRSALTDSRIGIVGFGSIGRTVAKMLSGFEVEIFGFSKSGRDNSIPINQLDAYLPTLDVIILLVPLNEETRGLFDARRLSLLKDGALLINVARGPVVATDALRAELISGRIFAALDVTDPEPLPKDHALWSAPNLLIVPHVGGDTTAFEPRAIKLVEEQLARLASGQALRNVVR